MNNIRKAPMDTFNKHHGEDLIPPLEDDPDLYDYSFEEMESEDEE